MTGSFLFLGRFRGMKTLQTIRLGLIPYSGLTLETGSLRCPSNHQEVGTCQELLYLATLVDTAGVDFSRSVRQGTLRAAEGHATVNLV